MNERDEFDRVMSRLLSASTATAESEGQRRELESMVAAMRSMRDANAGAGAGPVGGGDVGNGGGDVGSGSGGGGNAEEEEAWSHYEASLSSIAGQLAAGGPAVSRAAYADRDYWLHRLSDAALQREYVRQSEIYLEPSTAAALRGMAEMLLIKIGELMTKPAHARRAIGERQRSEQERAERQLEARAPKAEEIRRDDE